MVKITKKNKGHKKSGWDKKSRIKSNLFMLPSILGVLTFFVVPFFVVIYYSMIDNIVSKKFVFLIISLMFWRMRLSKKPHLIR